MTDVPLDADPLSLRPSVRMETRRFLLGLAVVAVVVAGFLALGSPAATLDAALQRLRAADPVPIVFAVFAEAGSFVGYVLLTWLVVGRGAERIGLVVSGQITLAGAAITRLLPTAGLGGIGLTLWALRRAGRTASQATRTLLTFLVLTYAVFLAALTAAGIAVLTGAAGDAPAWVGVGPVLFGATAIALAASVAGLSPERLRSDDARPRTRRIRQGVSALRSSLHDGARVAGSGDPRLLGALAWWGLDFAVLALAFAALGDTPAISIVAVGYFAGIVANTIPVPGAVTGGMTGILLLCGVPVDLVLPAVLLYRGLSLWLPVPVGLAALVALQRNVHHWTQQDDAQQEDSGARHGGGQRAATTSLHGARQRRSIGSVTRGALHRAPLAPARRHAPIEGDLT